MGKMPFRQIHLDFHTGGMVPGVGSQFDKKKFQKALQSGHVNSVNIFAKCHHGWLYYQNGVTETHPSLEGNLLDDKLEACAEIGVKTQIYMSAGLDEVAARKHPEWLFRNEDQSTTWAKDFSEAGYHELCMNTPYLDYLITQIEEVTRNYDTEGLWLDIVGARICYCQTCMNQLIEEGKDPRDEEAVAELGERTFFKYLERVEKAVKAIKPDMMVFQNSGHIAKGRRDIFKYHTNVELESLPTGGWGYDHFPLSARYVQGLGKEFLGMTGKFHTTWGEFGGFKHPNALRYEAALNLANGAKMCVGDQMHPVGLLDEVTYNLIGEAYKEVEEKEPWCDDVSNVADIAIISAECIAAVDEGPQNGTVSSSDSGAIRMLLEGNYLFDVIDLEGAFDLYKVLILPDIISVNQELEGKLKAYVAAGGKLLVTGKSGLRVDKEEFGLDLGVTYEGKNPYQPDYLVPSFDYHGLGSTSFIMYSEGVKIGLDGGEVLGEREDSYFNRDRLHFSSHYHTPNNPGKRSPGMVKSQSGIYMAWQVFHDYATKGSLILKDMVIYALDLLLEDKKTLSTTLQAQGVTTIQHQQEQSRYVHHLLYATPVKRGDGVEIIEDMIPVYNIDNTVRINEDITKVYLAPSMEEIPFEAVEGGITYRVPEINCHQLVVLEY